MFSSGGGSTHIALTNTYIENMKNDLNKLLIVSGAGGGVSNWWGEGDNGGNGGGFNGTTTTKNFANYAANDTIIIQANNNPGYGTQTSGGKSGGNLDGWDAEVLSGKFGIGGVATKDMKPANCSGSGGGGYYGGDGSWGGSGAGGSGYIGNTSLTDKHMACYDCETSNEESTKTISVTCASETPTTDCAKIGNGYARITYIGN